MNHWRAIFSWDVVPDVGPSPRPFYNVGEEVIVESTVGQDYYATVRSIHPVGDVGWRYTVQDDEGIAHVVDETDLTAAY